jgi:hypothetical protein
MPPHPGSLVLNTQQDAQQPRLQYLLVLVLLLTCLLMQQQLAPCSALHPPAVRCCHVR